MVYKFEATCKNVIFKQNSLGNGITCVNVHLEFDRKTVQNKIIIKWRTNAAGCYSLWSPLEVFNHDVKPEWSKAETDSRSASGMPIQTYIDNEGKNVVTVAFSDVRTPVRLCSGVIEETAKMQWELILFLDKTEMLSEYDAEIYIDERSIAYEDVIKAAAQRWERDKVRIKNDLAFDPVYSTWYSYHQNVTDALLEELKDASELGMKTVIIDDGWQTDDNGRGYGYCGEWEYAKSKISDTKRFVDSVHAMGMKVMYWYSVPFIGMHSSVYGKFEGKYLYSGTDYSVLDPRYPDVREYLVSTYIKAVREYGLDGLKLDFIDSFCMKDETCKFNRDMDILSLENAVCTLLKEIYNSLTAINKDILIEFRQGYVGPIMMNYGNMLRAYDCPMNALSNRIRTINLRLISDTDTAVHSDMLMWDYNASAECAAEQIINVLFAVPQISVRLKEITKDHYKMLQFYIKLWSEYKDIIQHGTLRAENPGANYTFVSAEHDNIVFAVSYTDKLVRFEDDPENIVLINGTGTNGLYLELNGSYSYEIYKCTGECIEKKCTDPGIKEITVPISGVIKLKKGREV